MMNKFKNILKVGGIILIFFSYSYGQIGNYGYIENQGISADKIPLYKTILNKITVSVSGVSKKYEKLFRDSINIVAKELAKSDVDTSILPIEVRVEYKEGSGTITMTAQYDTSRHLITAFLYPHTEHYVLNLRFPRVLLGALNRYKMDVAILSGEFNKIMDFELMVSLKKKNKDVLMCSGRSYETGLIFSQYIGILYKNNIQMITATNREADPRMIFQQFMLGDPYYLDGKKAPEYAAYKFFNLPTDK